jgi:iron-regulated transporter 1
MSGTPLPPSAEDPFVDDDTPATATLRAGHTNGTDVENDSTESFELQELKKDTNEYEEVHLDETKTSDADPSYAVVDTKDIDDEPDDVERSSPAHSTQMLYLLYLSSFLTAFGDRMWGFAVPIILTSIFSSTLLPASLFAFATQLACVIFGTIMGKWVDDTPRQRVITVSLIVQNTGVIICSVILFFILPFEAGAEGFPPFGDWRFDVLMIGLIVVGSVAALASMVEDIAVGRDWVVVLSHGSRDTLAGANAMMTRISLVCKIAGPVAFGVVMNFMSSVGALIFVCIWNAFSIFPELFILLYLYKNTPGLQKKIQVKASLKGPNSFTVLWQGWKIYFQSKEVFLASLAFVFLFWTALAPGALLSAYLLTRGIEELTISIFQGIAAIIGIVPTFFSTHCFKRFGVERTGLYSIWAQQSCLILILFWFFFPHMVYLLNNFSYCFSSFSGFISIFYDHHIGGDWNVWLFLLFVVLSRIGLWSFDLSERQIMQEYVPEDVRGVVNSVEYSLTNVFSLGAYAMGIIASRPEQFGWLVIFSFVAVTSAAVCYTVWFKQRRRARAVVIQEE